MHQNRHWRNGGLVFSSVVNDLTCQNLVLKCKTFTLWSIILLFSLYNKAESQPMMTKPRVSTTHRKDYWMTCFIFSSFD